jgi:hypothetical protein
MESSDQQSLRTRAQHVSLNSADPPISRTNRRRSLENKAANTSRNQNQSVYRVDPYRYGNPARRGSGPHQVSYPASARYYASNSSSVSSSSPYVTNGHSYNPSNHATHLHHHPLQHQVLPSSTYRASSNRNQPSHSHHNVFSQPQGLTAAVQYTLKLQAQKVAEKLANKSNGHRHSKSKKGKKNLSLSDYGRRMDILQNLIILIMPILLFLIVSHEMVKHAPVVLDKATRDPEFKWRPNRKLQDRQCTLNMYIEKQPVDEFNPDFEEIKPGEKNKDGTPKLPSPPKFEPGGTYRTKGQVAVVGRFISAVADSFRPQAKVQQHLVFAGTRDGGHLAEVAMKFWPARGEFMTQLYIVADAHEDHSVSLSNNTLASQDKYDDSSRALQYGSLSAIEERFQNHKKSEHIHIFDAEGQKAGLIRSDLDDDDVIELKQEEMFGIEDDEILSIDVFDDDSMVAESPNYFSLKKLLSPFLDRADEDPNSITSHQEDPKEKVKHMIPYFHVDGRSASEKFDILSSAKPLFNDNTIVTVVVENSPDLDIPDLIEFFRSVNYKTFFLGKRQIMRIDHLCPEILGEVLSHPYIKKKEPFKVRKMLHYLNIIPQEKDAHIVHPHPKNEMLYPAFFVALPRGRHSKEEMTIQHMYDLFGGGGGGGQIATANDRKAPGKKKKK